MKKFLTLTVLALVLCLAVSIASADVIFNDGYTLDYGTEKATTAKKVTIKIGSSITVDGATYTVMDGVSQTATGTAESSIEIERTKANCNKPITLYVHYQAGGQPAMKAVAPIVFLHNYSVRVDCNKVKCEFCGDTIEKENHLPTEVIDVPATCTKDGEAHLECSACHKVLSDHYAKQGGHKFVTTWVSPECEKGVKEEDWQTDGHWFTQCVNCGIYTDEYEDDANAKANSDSTLYLTRVKDFVIHWFWTLSSYNAEREAHGLEKVDGHDWEQWRYIAPTCVSVGYKVRWCNRCDKDQRQALSDAELGLEQYKDWDKVLGPQWTLVLRDKVLYCDFAWTDSNPEAYIVCSVCGGSVAGHKITNTKVTAEDPIGGKYQVQSSDYAVTDQKQLNMKGTFTVHNLGATSVSITLPLEDGTPKTMSSTIDSSWTLTADVQHVFKNEPQYLVKDAAGNPIKLVPTCASKGYNVYKCVYETGAVVGAYTVTGLDYTLTGNTHATNKVAYADALGHAWDPWVEKFAPTETETGWWHRDCNRYVTTANGYLWKCNQNEDYHAYIAPCVEHAPVKVVDLAATCTAEGKQHWVCTKCGSTLSAPEGESEIIPATGHSYTIEEVVTAATCTKEGKKLLTCSACGATKTEPIAATGVHTLEAVEGKAPTCKETGLKAAFKCSVCGKLFADEKAETEITAQEEIPADPAAHVYEVASEIPATCTKKGQKIEICKVCGIAKTSELPIIPHDWDEGAITTPATVEAKGVKTFTCKVCGETKTEDVDFVPAETPAYSVKEADFDKGEMVVSGTVDHDPATKEAEKTYARVTFFMSDGTFVAFATVINPDGSFEAMTSGDVIHIAVQITDSAKVRPGEFNAFGGSEFDVK